MVALRIDFSWGEPWLLPLAIDALVSCGRPPSGKEPAVSPTQPHLSTVNASGRGVSASATASGSAPARPAEPMSVGTSSSSVSVTPRAVTECPPQLPEAGSSCEGALECTFEEAMYDECAVSAACRNEAWQVHPKPENCTPEVLAPRAMCPNKPRAVAGPCTQLDSSCHVDGTLCVCEQCVADRCLGAGKRWICLVSSDVGSLGCPEVIPRLGAPCSGARGPCDYGYWPYSLAKRRRCTDGHWTGEIIQRE